MFTLPDYVGPSAFGIKMGVIIPGSDLQTMILDDIMKMDADGMLTDGDVLAITESVVARAQNNFISIDSVAQEIQEILSLTPESRVGVVFPIISRNRFALILKSIARAVHGGQVIVQLSYPDDEVGNQIIPPDVAMELEKTGGGVIKPEDLGQGYTHPLTGVNYISLYEGIIRDTGSKPVIYLCNDPTAIADHQPDAVIAADIHTRNKTQKSITDVVPNCCTLQDICSRGESLPSSEWGLLGSNMSSEEKLKLAPYMADHFAITLQEKIYLKTGKLLEIIVYGDGAYKDPSSGIYELADPITTFGATLGIGDTLREGFKMKYLVDIYHEDGRSEEEIQKLLDEESKRSRDIHSIESEGTTPRVMKDVLASLADLISGSADAGTPMILIKGILKKQ
ncbi:MAG: hypothetical protein D5R96_07660 [Methanocalculus sp. MSAO_Arc2]|nr:MAG: hypothetical protein D5R96_07660 [Methanocalculus sp. MSAO_Arc2]